MKDEEMAEEYANIHTHYEVGKREDGTEYAKKVCDITIQQAFLAGIKARLQWHDLRKDPTDLPKDKEYVFVYTDLNNYYVAEKVDNHFISKSWEFIPMSTVIAWCEIPTFDKE